MGLSEVAKTRVYLGVILALLGGLGASLYYWSTTRDRAEFLNRSNEALRNSLEVMKKPVAKAEQPKQKQPVKKTGSK